MTETKDKKDETPKAPPAPAKPKQATVTVLRAVDLYHVRNQRLSVPLDEYHQGLIDQGNLRLEKGE